MRHVAVSSVCVFFCSLLLVAQAKFFNELAAGRDLVVLAAPSVWDENYRDSFYDIIRFQIDVAKTIYGHDNVIIVADKHTMPFLDGRTHLIRDRLPLDALIEANLYDIHLRDFAPFGVTQQVKFAYTPRDMVPQAAKQIDSSMKRFLDEHKLAIEKREPELLLNGADVIDNGMNKAIIDHRVLDDNKGRLPDWAIMIKLFNAFKKVVMITNPFNATVGPNNRQMRLDDAMAFVDQQILVIPSVDKETRAYLDAEIYKKFRDEVVIVDLPTNNTDDYGEWASAGICGMYTALLATDKFVYLPAFGNDPLNWKRGHSSMMDKMTIQLLQVNTRKSIVPINIPRAICERGIGLRALAWTLKGAVADQIVELARGQGRRRFSKYNV